MPIFQCCNCSKEGDYETLIQHSKEPGHHAIINKDFAVQTPEPPIEN